MPLIFKRLALLISITAAFAADKQTPFRPPAAGAMAHHQTNEQVTIGVEAYTTSDKLKTVFGKLDPNQYGVLPVLVVIENDSPKTLKADDLQVQYVAPNHSKADFTPAKEVKFLKPPSRPTVVPGPGAGIILKGKNPLDAGEIEGRAFAAVMIPPGQTASGFFYFQASLQQGATLYLNGLAEAGTGKELFYFEMPLE
jgi:hypothetical protein